VPIKDDRVSRSSEETISLLGGDTVTAEAPAYRDQCRLCACYLGPLQDRVYEPDTRATIPREGHQPPFVRTNSLLMQCGGEVSDLLVEAHTLTTQPDGKVATVRSGIVNGVPRVALTMETRQWTLARRPEGKPEVDDFAVETLSVGEPGPGELLVEVQYVSVDPYMRDRMAPGESYAEAWDVGDPVPAGGVGAVVRSMHDDWAEGDLVVGQLAWSEHVVVDGDRVNPVDTEVAPPAAYLGVLGLTGRTAYFGMLDVAEPRPGDTVVVSGAAGAVGSVAGQLARLAGARVIGIAGTDEKTTILTEEFGFDAAINYTTADVAARLGETCPDGVDVYFDNVGGPITDAVFRQLADNARLAICGQIALYNATSVPKGPRKLWQLVAATARVEGFLVGDFAGRYGEANERLARWVQDGGIKTRRTVLEGFDAIPDAFRGLFEGVNVGKLLVELEGPVDT
jgi:NADPH-dependent curcumin reductase CurA